MSEQEEAEAAPAADPPNANPVDWMVLADAVGKNDPIPEWPIIFDLVPKLKCSTCGRKFVSPINLRRHVIIHDQDYIHSKMYSEADKKAFELYLETVNLKNAASFERVKLKVNGFEFPVALELKSYYKNSKIVFPGAYIKAGELLLDAVESYKKRGPCRMTVKQLFQILNDASEDTSYCYGIDDPVQTFVFQDYGEMPENNIVACTAFLLERKLVDEWSSLKKAEALWNEEDNQKESQAKPEEKKKKPKKKKANTQKQVVEPELKATECDDDTSKYPIETSIHGSDPSDQLPKADLPSGAEKGNNGGSGQEPYEKKMQDDISTECQQKDAEQEVEEQPTRPSKSKVNNMKKAERKARKKIDQKKKKKKNHGNKSDTMTVTGSPRPDAIQICDAEEDEDRKCVQKEEALKEQQKQDATDTWDSLQSGETSCFGAASESPTPKETQITQPDQSDPLFNPVALPVPLKSADAEGSQERSEIKELHSQSENKKETHDDPATNEPNKDEFQCPIASLADDPDNVNRVKEDFDQVWQKMLLRLQDLHTRNLPRSSQKPEEAQVIAPETKKDQQNEDKNVKDVKHASELLHSGETPSSSKPENPTEIHITQQDQSSAPLEQVILPDSHKSTSAVATTKELDSQSENKKETSDVPAAKKSSKDEFPIANLADDQDDMKRGKEDSGPDNTTKEQQNEDKNLKDVKHASDLLPSDNTPSSSALSESPTETKIAQQDQTKEVHSHSENKKESSEDPATESIKDEFPVASLADDPDNIRRVKEDFEQVWEKMLLRLQDLHNRNRPRFI